MDPSGNVVVTGYSDNGITNEVNSRVYYTANYASADGALLWEQRYDSPAHYSEARAVAVDAAGNVLVTGLSHGTNSVDYCTVKYAAADGTMLWEHCYDGPSNGVDRAVAVSSDSSGDVIVTGVSHNGRDNDFYTAKYAAGNGALVWEKRFDSPGTDEDSAVALAVAADGDVIVTGRSWAGDAGAYDYYTARYAAADGALLWEKFAGSAEWDEPDAVAVDHVGNVIVTGYSFDRPTKHDYYTVKYAAADGALLWDRRFTSSGFSEDFAHSVAVDNTGNVFVTGTSRDSYYRHYTIKYAAADGTPLWGQPARVPADFHDRGRAIALDDSGNVVVTARSDGDGTVDFYTAKYARTTGAILWERRDPGDRSGEPSALATDIDGNVIVTGSSRRDVTGLDFYTAKYAAADGAILWQKYYDAASTNDVGTAAVVDSHNDVVVTGYSHNGTNLDYYTAKYAAADGGLVWEKRFNGPSNRNDFPSALALDGNGNVIVTGTSGNQNSTNFSDFYTVKYSAADGAVLWDRRYDGPARWADEAKAVAVDRGGNVIVTGTSENDFYTAKYAAANGAVLWEKRETNDSLGFVSAVAVDSGGNVIVSGTSFGIEGSQLYTIKYAAANGAFLWDRTTPGIATAGAPSSLAIDSADNVIVAGSVSGPTPQNYQDYYAAKFAGTNGALLWEKRYDGPGDQTESLAPRGLVVRDGMVALTGTSAGDPPEHDDEPTSPHGELLPGQLAKHVVHYEMATVVFWEKVPPVFIARVPAGVRLRFAGNPDSTYHVQRATVVTGPWDTIATVTAPADGRTEYLDTAPPSGMFFYRVSMP